MAAARRRPVDRKHSLGAGRIRFRPASGTDTIQRGISERTDFELDYRTVNPDGTIKYVHALGHPVFNAAGDLVEFVGTSIDVTQRRRAEEARLDAQNQLAHVHRVTAMGQLAASIAHEVNQPIAATVTNAQAALRWLDRRPPDLEEVRQALARIAKDGHRAAEVIDEIRALIKKAPPRKDRLEINGAIHEVIALTRGEAVKNGVSVQTELVDGLPLIEGDRVQLQQVILNLIINAVRGDERLSARGCENCSSVLGKPSRTACSSRCEIRARDWHQRRSNVSSSRSTRPSQAVWG